MADDKITINTGQAVSAVENLRRALVRYNKVSKSINDNIIATTKGLGTSSKAINKQSQSVKNLTLSWQTFERLIIARLLTQAFHRLISNITESTEKAAEFLVRVGEVQTITASLEKTALGFENIAAAAFSFSDSFNFELLDSIEAFYDNLSNQVAESTSELTSFNIASAQLAKTTRSSFEQASNLISAIMNSYNQSGSDAFVIAQQLFTLIDEGRVRAEELANTFGRVTTTANQLGIGLDEVSAAIASLTITGVPAAESMTLLRNVMFKLQRPTKAMQALFTQWGVESGEAAIATFGFSNVLEKFNEESKKGAQEFGELFGRIRALRGAIGLTGKAFEDYQQNLEAIRNSEERFAEAFDLVFKNRGEVALRSINQVKNAFVHDFGVNAVEVYADLVNSNEEFTNQVIIATQAVVILGASLAALAVTTGVINLLGSALTGLGIAAAGPIVGFGAVILGIAAALTVGLKSHSLIIRKSFNKTFSEIKADLDQVSQEIQQKLAIEIATKQAKEIDKITEAFQDILEPLAQYRAKLQEANKQSEIGVFHAKNRLKQNVEILKVLESGNDIQRRAFANAGLLVNLERQFGFEVSVSNKELEKRVENAEKSQDFIRDFNKSLRSSALDRFQKSLNPIAKIFSDLSEGEAIFGGGLKLFKEDPEEARKMFQEGLEFVEKAAIGAEDIGLPNIANFNKILLSIQGQVNALEGQFTAGAGRAAAELERRQTLIDQTNFRYEITNALLSEASAIIDNTLLTEEQRSNLLDQLNKKAFALLGTENQIFRLKTRQLQIERNIRDVGFLQDEFQRLQKEIKGNVKETDRLKSSIESATSSIKTSGDALGKTFGVSFDQGFRDKISELGRAVAINLTFDPITGGKFVEKNIRPLLDEVAKKYPEVTKLIEDYTLQVKALSEEDNFEAFKRGNENLTQIGENIIEISKGVVSLEQINKATKLFGDLTDMSTALLEKRGLEEKNLIIRMESRKEKEKELETVEKQLLPLREQLHQLIGLEFNAETNLVIEQEKEVINQQSLIPAKQAEAIARSFNADQIEREAIALLKMQGLISAGRVGGQDVFAQRQGLIPPGFAEGGPTGTDTIPAWLTPGEFVMRRSATAKNFYALSAMNAGLKPQYYAHGGEVRQDFKQTFINNSSGNSKIDARRQAGEIRRQIVRNKVTLQPKITRPY